MFVAKTVSVGTTAVELTSGINVDQEFILTLRIPAAFFSSSTTIRVGDSSVSSGSGFTLDVQSPALTLRLQGESVFAVAGGSSTGAPVDVLVYST